MRFAWARVVRDALGGRRTISLGLLLISLGVLGKLVLVQYANIETIFVATLLAGSVLGRWWTVIVPLGILAVLQPIAWGALHPGYEPAAILGITFFVVSGFVFVGLAGRSARRHIVLRVKSVALLTTISVPLTIAYDVWTDVGDWYFLFRPAGIDFATVLGWQVPFTVYHVLSSLIFVPLFGSAFLVLAYAPAKADHADVSRVDRPDPR
ncbi:MAG: DUF6580 family putative transport protein [Methanobacteriota archaeon]